MRLQRDCTPLGVVIIVSAIMMTGLIVPRSRYDGSISATVGARGILGRGVRLFPSHFPPTQKEPSAALFAAHPGRLEWAGLAWLFSSLI